MVNLAFGGIYTGKRALVTGHTGFKGGWLSLWLHELGADVFGFSLPAGPDPNLFDILPKSIFSRSILDDLRNDDALRSTIKELKPDIIFHLAAQPLVGVSYRDPVGTFTTNALGTIMLLEAVRESRCPAAIVIVTSDKCYRNDNHGRPFREDDPLGGHDVYSMSKAATELAVASWHASFFETDSALGPLATGRAGNVIGGGDYAEDRIIPDAVRATLRGKSLQLRRPHATRPWQHVLESASGYLALGTRLLAQPGTGRLPSFNFGPDATAERSVRELVDAWLAAWPHAFAFEPLPGPAYAESARLSLDHSKAVRELGWKPVWDFQETVARTAAWYRLRHEAGADNEAMSALTLGQIRDYTGAARRAGAGWSTRSIA